jgi:REP element-mobilizing transposase RayT
MRLPHYDYATPGAYFVTVCVQERAYLFGEIIDGEMRLNGFGGIVQACWEELPRHYRHIEMDAFVVMPNHVHGIIVLTDVGAGLKPAPTACGAKHGLPEIVRAFKTLRSRLSRRAASTRKGRRRATPYGSAAITNA